MFKQFKFIIPLLVFWGRLLAEEFDDGVEQREQYESYWSDYYEITRYYNVPQPTLQKAVELFEGRGGLSAIDLGCGVGRDTAYLTEKGWRVIAIDAERVAANYVFQMVPEEQWPQVTFIASQFENYAFDTPVDLINASFSFPYCLPWEIHRVVDCMKACLKSGGRFSGQFFGKQDSWTDIEIMSFFERDELLELFSDFEIEYFAEEEKDAPSGAGPRHWHIYHIIAKKP